MKMRLFCFYPITIHSKAIKPCSNYQKYNYFNKYLKTLDIKLKIAYISVVKKQAPSDGEIYIMELNNTFQ